MIRVFVFILILVSGNCRSLDKKDWKEKLETKDKVRFQIPVFEVENVSREKRIQISQEFANLWTKISGYEAIVLDEQIKSDLLRTNGQIPSTNFSIQSKISNAILRLLVVDLETGEILTYGKIELSSEEEFGNQFEKIIDGQLLSSN